MNKRTGITLAAFAALVLIATIASRVLWRGESPQDHAAADPVELKWAVEPAIGKPPNPPLDESVPAAPLKAKPERASLTANLPDTGTAPWPTPEFEGVFGWLPGNDPLQKVHRMFVTQSRDAAWADAMESAISQSLTTSEKTAGITVSFLECRATICEVAGAMPDRMNHPELDPRNQLPEDFGSGWWQGQINVGIGTHTYEDEGITRYIMVITDADVFLSANDEFLGVKSRAVDSQPQ